MHLEQLLAKFNTPNTHLIISRWPSDNPEARFDGIATYTQEIVQGFVETQNAQFVILAEKSFGEPLATMIDKNILVLRVFDPHHQSLFPVILIWLHKFSNIKQVYVHSEFCASGGPKMRMLIIPFLWLIRMTGRKITFYAHNVVDNLKGIAPHLNMSSESIKTNIFTFLLKQYLRLLSLPVNRYVVLEEIIKNRLEKYAFGKEIIVQPHWVRKRAVNLTKKQARKKLGLPLNKKIALSFGFVTYYKGADWFARFADNSKKDLKNWHFVLAGGPAYSLVNEEYYQEYYTSLEQLSKKNRNLTLTGFIAEKDIAVWMKAADILVFPYRGLIGGSGALTQALHHSKPLWQSTNMLEFMINSKVLEALKKANLSVRDISFSLHKNSFNRLLRQYDSSEYQKKLQKYSRRLQFEYNFKKLVSDHYQSVYR